MEAKTGTSFRRMLEDGRATPAVLTFLRGTRVRGVISLALWEDEGGRNGQRGKGAHRRMNIPPVLPFFFS